MNEVWVVTTRDTFGHVSLSQVFDNEAAADEYARNAWGASVDGPFDVRSDCPDWARDIKKVVP